MTEANAATWLRTLAQLRPLQVVMRPPAMLARRLAKNVPSIAAPTARREWPAPPAALVAHANEERARGAERIARLTHGSALRAYEEVYGLELGADRASPHADWTKPVAIAPFPASVRARRIAVAIRLGRVGLDRELARAARAVAMQLELHILGNHLLENAIALVCAGAAARGPEADAWSSLGRVLLAWQLPRQFLADGGHFERSASYHLALTAALLETIELADASGRAAPAAWRHVAVRAVTWALDVRAPDGGYPLFNDAALDAAPSIDSVVSLARAVGVPAAASPSQSPVARIEPTGWLRKQSSDGAWLVVDAGPDGARDQPGHTHADGLTFELWARGRRLVVDYGVASYADDEARRTTRETRSHNTVELDRTDSCEVWGAFRVGRRGRAEVVRAESKGDRSVAELAHDGYAWMPGSPRHHRTLTLTPGRLEVVDRVEHGRKPFVSRLRLDEKTPPAAFASRATAFGSRRGATSGTRATPSRAPLSFTKRPPPVWKRCRSPSSGRRLPFADRMLQTAPATKSGTERPEIERHDRQTDRAELPHRASRPHRRRAPGAPAGGILVDTTASLISAGTERMIVDLAKKSMVDKARERPDLVAKVIDKAKREGVLAAFDAVRAKLDSPIPLGYSLAGRVSAVGRNTTEFAVGDRVACAGAGYANHAEMNAVPRNLAVRLPDGVSDEEAAFVTVAAIGLQGVRLVHPQLGELVVVIGLGLIGQITVQLLVANGCDVVGIDVDRAKVDRAIASGAVAGAVAGADDVVEIVRACSHGRGADSIVITASSPNNEPLVTAGDVARDRARISVVGMLPLEIPRKAYFEKELEVVVSRSYGPGRYDPELRRASGHDYPIGYVRWTERRNLQAVLRAIATRRLDVKSLITHRFALRERARRVRAHHGARSKPEPHLGVVLTYLRSGRDPNRRVARHGARPRRPRRARARRIEASASRSSAPAPSRPASSCRRSPRRPGRSSYGPPSPAAA